MIKKNIVFILLLWVASASFAQEYLTGLHSNPLIAANKHQGLAPKTTAEVHLPFMDDFSYMDRFYPIDTLWADRNVFINSTYAVNPPTVGVATFDAINDTGAIYTSATPTPFLADYLTSLPIRLDTMFDGTGSIDASDSVYFSFYYQPQGVADSPNPNDSLILEFYAPDTNRWIKVWGAGGMTLDAFRTLYNSYFKLVMIPIVQAKYLKDSFQFRFINYASIAPLTIPSWQSNCDQWNIDYVYLNVGRSKTDTLQQDIAFVDPAPTILKNYQRIPARHFTNADLATNLVMKESNRYDILTNMAYGYFVNEENGPFNQSYTGGVGDIYPFITNGYHNYPPHINPPVNFTLPSFGSSDTAVFDIKHYMSSNGWTDKNRGNDTIVHRQEFTNAYAYDDGTAENGYGLSVASAKLAYEFTINQPDTLGGVAMYFNETLSNPYYKYFYLTVWSSLNPETIIYKSERKRPEFADSINKFYIYPIKDTAVLVSGTFFVGWQQTTDDNLNVGFDRNTNAKSHTLFNIDGTWLGSSLDGTLMIRPLVGTAWQSSLSGISESSAENFNALVYPNPANGNILNISLPAQYNTEKNRGNITFEVYDYLGQKLLEKPWSTTLDISALSNGMYFVRFLNKLSGKVFVSKFVITR
jgi:hypothetical protein